ncbi:Yip1 family protein [Candidatus Aenigmatarchaeota archaeon]
MEVIKNPIKALNAAKKKQNINRTLTLLLEISVIYGIAAVILGIKLPLFTGLMGVVAFVSAFLLTIVAALFFGLILHTIAGIMGGKGEYYNGLTTITYAMIAPSFGILIAAILSFIPFIGAVIGVIVLALTLAHGFSLLYRGTKDLYKIDMVTTLVIISVLTLTIIAALWLSSAMNITSLQSIAAIKGF